MEVYSGGVSVPVSTSSDELLTVHMNLKNVYSFEDFSIEVVMIFSVSDLHFSFPPPDPSCFGLSEGSLFLNLGSRGLFLCRVYS